MRRYISFFVLLFVSIFEGQLLALTPEFLGRWMLVQEGRALGARAVHVKPVGDSFRIELDIQYISPAVRRLGGIEYIRGKCFEQKRPWAGVGYPSPDRVTLLSLQEVDQRRFRVEFEFEINPRRIVKGTVFYTLRLDGMLEQTMVFDTFDYNPVERDFIRVAHVTLVRLYERVEGGI